MAQNKTIANPSKLKFNEELLKEIATIVGGKNAAALVALLFEGKHINEFIIAKKLELTINQTRNVLYKMADEGLVSSIRKKDKKKGWYTYFWMFNKERAFLLLREKITDKINQLQKDLDTRKVKRFYYSKVADVEYTEEQALEHDYICPETGDVMELKDNTETIKGLEREVAKYTTQLDEINQELSFIDTRRQKKMVGDKKKEIKEKLEKRRKAAEERKKIKDKLAKVANKGKKKKLSKPKASVKKTNKAVKKKRN